MNRTDMTTTPQEALRIALEHGLELARENADSAEVHALAEAGKPKFKAYADESVMLISRAIAALSQQAAQDQCGNGAMCCYVAAMKEAAQEPQPGSWSIHFEDGRDFCRHASLLIGAAYISADDALKRFQDNSLYGERTFGKVYAAAPAKPAAMTLHCPKCEKLHVDEGEWATRPHKTHQCQHCMHEWRPFEYPTVGVAKPSEQEKAPIEALCDSIINLRPESHRHIEYKKGHDAATIAAANLVLAHLQQAPSTAAQERVAEELRKTLVAITPAMEKGPNRFDFGPGDDDERFEAKGFVQGWNACRDEVLTRANRLYNAALAKINIQGEK